MNRRDFLLGLAALALAPALPCKALTPFESFLAGLKPLDREIVRQYVAGKSASQIAAHMKHNLGQDVSRNRVIGRLHRIGEQAGLLPGDGQPRTNERFRAAFLGVTKPLG